MTDLARAPASILAQLVASVSRMERQQPLAFAVTSFANGDFKLNVDGHERTRHCRRHHKS